MDLLDKAKNFITEKLTDIPKPEPTVNDVDLKHVTRESVEYNADISVKNPYSHSIPICEISYSFKSCGKEIASGKIADPGSLKPKDVTGLQVPFKIPYDILLTLAKDIGSDWDIDYQLDIGFTVDLPVIGEFTIPVSSKGQIKLPSFSDLF